MEIIFLPQALEDLQQWKKSGNEKVLKKIRELLENIQQTPFEGIGKTEALKYQLPVNGREGLRMNTVWFIKLRRIELLFIR